MGGAIRRASSLGPVGVVRISLPWLGFKLMVVAIPSQLLVVDATANAMAVADFAASAATR